ncbi:helix-turn-helix domain-containing protein [Streptomycetaceae bacterium NBC_01309]
MPKRTSQRAPAAPDPTTRIAPADPAVSADDGTLPGLAPDTPPAFPPGADAADRVRAVLATAGPDGMTAAEIADAARVARSTVSKLLGKLTKNRTARREAGGFIGRSRQPDRWHPVTASDETASGTAARNTAPGASAPTPASAPAPTPDDTANARVAAGTSASNADAAGPGAEADSARDAAPAAPAAPDTPTPPDRADSGPDTAPVAPVPAAAPDPEPAVGGTPARLGPGALRRMVFEHVNTHPGQAFTPGEIGRALGGRSSGAVANACDKLTAEGLVELACEKPRRFRATAPAPTSGADAEHPTTH